MSGPVNIESSVIANLSGIEKVAVLLLALGKSRAAGILRRFDQDELKALFDQQAADYDARWAKTRPIRDCLHLLLDSAFAPLPQDDLAFDWQDV